MKPLIAAMRMFFIVVRPATAQDNERADTTFKLGSHGLLELDPGDPPCPEYLADPRRARMLVGIDRAILSTLSTVLISDRDRPPFKMPSGEYKTVIAKRNAKTPLSFDARLRKGRSVLF
jgi:hypothetical protein